MLKSSEGVSYLTLEPKTAKAKKLIFMFHGYAQRASHMMNIVGKKLAPHFPETKIYSINGFHECKGYEGKRRYDWLRFNGNEWNPNTIQLAANNTAGIISNFIRTKLAENSLSGKDAVMIGFSQGTRVSLHTSLRSKGLCAGVIGFSGALSLPEYLAVEINDKPRIMLIHGTGDDILPCSESIKAAALLEQLNVNVQLELIQGLDHNVNQEGVQIAAGFIKNIFKN